jgi:hypothetical protein
MTKISGLLMGLAAGAALTMAASSASAVTVLLTDTVGDGTSVLNTSGELTGGNSAVASSFAGIAFTDIANFTIAPGELLTSYSITSNGNTKIAPISDGTAEIFTAANVAVAGSLVTIDTASAGHIQFTDFSDSFDLGPGSYYVKIISSGLKTVGSQGASKYSLELQGVAVPEPATWAVMMLGFGAIGASMRQARRRAIA